MELADLMYYHDTEYIVAPQTSHMVSAPSYDRIVETVINLQDLAGRLMGGNITTRPNVIRKRAVLIAAPCLNLTDRLPDYQRDARSATRDAVDELARRFTDCIEDHLHGQAE
jgi:hypothetical protein